MGHKDLRLGQIVQKLVFYNISFSWILPLVGFQFIFLLRDSENDLVTLLHSASLSRFTYLSSPDSCKVITLTSIRKKIWSPVGGLKMFTSGCKEPFMKSKKRNMHSIKLSIFFLGNVTWFLSEYGNYPSLLHSVTTLKTAV